MGVWETLHMVLQCHHEERVKKRSSRGGKEWTQRLDVWHIPGETSDLPATSTSLQFAPGSAGGAVVGEGKICFSPSSTAEQVQSDLSPLFVRVLRTSV